MSNDRIAKQSTAHNILIITISLAIQTGHKNFQIIVSVDLILQRNIKTILILSSVITDDMMQRQKVAKVEEEYRKKTSFFLDILTKRIMTNFLIRCYDLSSRNVEIDLYKQNISVISFFILYCVAS